MNYIFHNHYYIEPMTPVTSKKTILLAEPEQEARVLYYRHLSNSDASVILCTDLSTLLEDLTMLKPDLLVINPGENPANSLAFLRNIKKTQPNLRIITIGYGTPDEYLDRFMQLGVSYHINRHLTRPQDVAVAAQQVLEDSYSLNI